MRDVECDDDDRGFVLYTGAAYTSGIIQADVCSHTHTHTYTRAHARMHTHARTHAHTLRRILACQMAISRRLAILDSVL